MNTASMTSLLLPVAILALIVDDVFSSRQPSTNNSSNMPQIKNRPYHTMDSREEFHGLAEERSSLSLRGTKASTRQMQAVFPKLLAPTSIPSTSSPASSNSPSSQDTNSFSRMTTSQIMIDDVVGMIDYQPPTHHTIFLQIFLLNTSMLMDDQSRSTFELTALEFIVDGIDQIDLSIETVSDITVVDQRLTWSRMVDGQSTTGIEVYFEADATVPSEIKQRQLERAMQALFDTKAKAFRRTFNLALRDGEDAESPDPVTETLEPIKMRVPLGLAATGAGCLGFIAILLMSAFYVNKKEEEESKDLSKTSITDENNDNAVRGRIPFPVQEATGQQHLGNLSSDSDEVLTFDNGSFNASLVFCPSVEKEPKDLSRVFDCDQSAIANIETLTDSDADETYEYSPIRTGAMKDSSHKRQLTDEDLSNFDDEMRRAEC